MVLIEIVIVFQRFRSSTRSGIDTIGKNIKNNRIDIKNLLFDGLAPEISLVKGGPGHSARGWGSGQSGCPLTPGGECFAPLLLYELELPKGSNAALRVTWGRR